MGDREVAEKPRGAENRSCAFCGAPARGQDGACEAHEDLVRLDYGRPELRMLRLQEQHPDWGDE
jgi:hypothetical protein